MWATGAAIRFRAGGAELEGICTGPEPGKAPTIVLLHEGLGSARLWRDFPEKLAARTGWGVFAYSRRGYGASDPAILPRPVDYMTREAVEVLPEVLDAIGFRRGILAGHSDGGSIAAIHGGMVGDPRVTGLVLMAPHFFTEPEGLQSIAKARAAFDSGGLREKLARHHDDPDNAFFGWNDAWLNPLFHDWNIEAVIAGIRVPVLALQGVDDQYGMLRQIEVIREQAGTPVELAVLAGCGHAPHAEKPDETIAAV